jgi:hypothetical protein
VNLLTLIPARLRPYAKALLSALTPLLLFVAHGLISGEWDLKSLDLIVGALITGVTVYGVPNQRADQ